MPLPKKLFSLIPNPTEPPSVPMPAWAEISPVGFSSIVILISLVLFWASSIICFSTFLKKFKLLMLLIDLLTNISLKGHLHQLLIDYE